MLLIVKVVDGPCYGRRFQLRSGQVAQVGRTEWSDFSLPDDESMADVHFTLECGRQNACVRSLNLAVIQVNGKNVSFADLLQGDRLTAGRTTFEFLMEGLIAPAPASISNNGNVEKIEPADEPTPTAAQVCKPITLEEEARSLLEDDQTPAQYIDLLSKSGFYPDALRVMAAWLPKRSAVWWGVLGVRQTIQDLLKPNDAEWLELAERWVIDTDEKNRRAAESALDQSGSAASIAQAVFWSGDSIAPAGAPQIAPAEHLTGSAIAGALIIAATSREPEKTMNAYKSLLEIGRKLASGEIELPKPSEDQ